MVCGDLPRQSSCRSLNDRAASGRWSSKSLARRTVSYRSACTIPMLLLAHRDEGGVVSTVSRPAWKRTGLFPPKECKGANIGSWAGCPKPSKTRLFRTRNDHLKPRKFKMAPTNYQCGRPDDRTKSQRQSWIAVGMVMFILADEPTYRAQSPNINALPRGPWARTTQRSAFWHYIASCTHRS
jgi:hypothetical protein